MNLRCLVHGHNWRLAEPWQNAGWEWEPGQPPVWGMCHDVSGTTYAGFGLRVQCSDCGVRAMAEFRHRQDWAKRIDTGWQLHVKHWRGGLVADAPASDEVELAIRAGRRCAGQ